MPSSSIDAARPGRLVRAAALALLCLASVAVALILGEAALRVSGFSFPSFTVPDDITGSRLRPNASGWYRNEGEAFVRINSHGLRADREYAFAKAPGTVRVAVLGDSFAHAAGTPAEATFWAHLERELNTCRAFGDKRAEVLNFGVSGYGTAQELLTLRHRAAKYSPDIVLLAFFPGNDVRNNSKRLEEGKLRPFFVLRDSELELDDSFVRDPAHAEHKRAAESRTALQDLRVYQLVRRARAGEFRLGHNTPVAMAIAKGERAPAAAAMSEAGLDENVLREPQDPAWHEAWTITEKLLLLTSEEAQRGGARFILATLSSSGSVYPDQSLRKKYAAHLGVPDLFYPERRIRSLAERHGIEAVILGPEMQRQADATGTYYHGYANAMIGFGHWNHAGHELAGKLISRHLCPPTQ
jgi:hypothetical protein